MKVIFRRVLGKGLQAKLIYGIFWSFLGTLFSKGFNLLAFILIARFFSVEDYGKVGIIKSFIATFTLFSLASFGLTATKYLAIYKEIDKAKAGKILSLTRLMVSVLSVFILAVVVIFSDYISKEFLGDVSLSNDVKIASLAIFFASLNGYQVGALAGFEKFKKIAVINSLNGLLSLPIIIFLGYKYGVVGVVISLSLVNFVLWLTSAYYLQKVEIENQILFTLKGSFQEEWKIIKDFSLPSFLSSIMISPVVLVCNSILIKKTGYDQMGFYDAAYNFSIIAITLNTIVGQVLYPFSMKLFEGGNRKFDFINIQLPWYIGLMVALPLLIFPDIFSQIFGQEYQQSTMYLTVTYVTLFTLIMSQRQGIARNFAAANYLWFSLLGNFIWGLSSVFFVYILSEFGAVGRSQGFFYGYLLNSIILIPFYLYKKLVDSVLILSRFNVVIIVIIFISSVIFYLDVNFFNRIIVLITMVILSNFVFIKWYNNYVRE